MSSELNSLPINDNNHPKLSDIDMKADEKSSQPVQEPITEPSASSEQKAFEQMEEKKATRQTEEKNPTQPEPNDYQFTADFNAKTLLGRFMFANYPRVIHFGVSPEAILTAARHIANGTFLYDNSTDLTNGEVLKLQYLANFVDGQNSADVVGVFDTKRGNIIIVTKDPDAKEIAVRTNISAELINNCAAVINRVKPKPIPESATSTKPAPPERQPALKPTKGRLTTLMENDADLGFTK
jgi:hypothetical protein